MHTQSPAAALREHFEIAPRLRRLYHSKCVLLSGDRQVRGIVTGDLEKHSRIRAALVSLPRGVQEARAESQARGHPLGIANRRPDSLEGLFVRLVHFNVPKESEVVAGAEPIQMSAQVARD